MNLQWSAYPINSGKFLPNFANPKYNLEKLCISVDGGLVFNGYTIGTDVLSKFNEWKSIQGVYTGKDLQEEKIDGCIVLHKFSQEVL